MIISPRNTPLSLGEKKRQIELTGEYEREEMARSPGKILIVQRMSCINRAVTLLVHTTRGKKKGDP